MSQRILILGAGFAGLWSALGAARALDELGVGPERVEVAVVNRTAWHSIRVRNYEADLEPTRVKLSQVLNPVGVKHIEGEVTGIDVAARTVTYSNNNSSHHIAYDRLVFALGSRLVRPEIPGLAQYGFDVDTYEAAARLNAHIAKLPSLPPLPGKYDVLVVGGGLTGIETATEMVAKLRRAIAAVSGPQPAPAPRVVLADRQPWIGSDMGESARPVIAEALRALGVETRVGVSVARIDEHGAILTTGERIATATVIWCAGMQANPLTACFGVERDRFGRLPVDDCLKIKGLSAEFAAGDVAWFLIDGARSCVMSCQHGRPMGRFAGHNAACDLLGKPLLPLRIDWYTTILDLGRWGAVYTEGWDRRVASTGAAAKRTKEMINRQRIYPPLSGNRRELLDAAAPVVQTPPLLFH
ncbi:MAG: FAD-dependent oxidoreductase [Acetobacteraceae bacterium]|nr:FAD-dependent oxidoreductase [Acetobacteraceae bacterium]